MLGFGSLEIALAYILCLAASALCVGYGIMHWNDHGEPDKVKVKRVVKPNTTDAPKQQPAATVEKP